MDNNLLNKIKQDFTDFLDRHFLLKDEEPDFYEHYLRASIIAEAIGESTPEFNDKNKLNALKDAAKYCDIGLDIEIKKGKQIPPDEKQKRLKHHVQKSMDILWGGHTFFKHAILLIAWHHWQPDGNGYAPTRLPALKIYKEGGNIIAVSTAFDSIFTRFYKKCGNRPFSMAAALSIMEQNTSTQFSEIYYQSLKDVLKKGIKLYFEKKQLTIKKNSDVARIMAYMKKTGNFNYEDFTDHNKKEGQSVKKNDHENFGGSSALDKFEQYFQRGLSGELYNITEINHYMDIMLEILSENMEQFMDLFVKLLTFMSQFTYPDGEIKSFVINAFTKGLDHYFVDSTITSIESVMGKSFVLWELYLNNSLNEKVKRYFTENIYHFFFIVTLMKDNYQFSKASVPKHLISLSDEIVEALTNKTLKSYNPQEIDFIKTKISHIKEFNKIWA